MDARLTPARDVDRPALRALLEQQRGPAGPGPGLWTALADRFGLPALTVPETYGGRTVPGTRGGLGGLGGTATLLALACEETGRALTPTPLLATSVLAAPLVLALGTDAQRAELLPALASGTLTATLAAPGPGLATALALTGPNDGDWAGGGRAGGVQARRDGDGWLLYGQADRVLDGDGAHLLLVAAHTGGFARSRTLLYLVRADATGLHRSRQPAPDGTRPQARVQLRDVPAELLGDEHADVLAALAATGDTVAAAVACEAVGAAGRALEHAGAPDGPGDIPLRVRAARAAARHAAWASGGEADGTGAKEAVADRLGVLALAQALDALRGAAAEAVHASCGRGFAAEREAHLYMGRAAGDEALFGPVHRLREHGAGPGAEPAEVIV
ncbi:acyl-CoA dehydrogenase [Streptomyces sp. Ru71]|uniref:acyl-CoA dehydrogenase family protein n=1 Tax=Streptomyces sp. Ru71 TaxID=2080746 RepID=UPI000CDDBE6F|nr:acyl-CoA dehydrogenase family protein [Streptomyces sp. Ru71]POX46970.1 acyl-CoA dehydrogenase [Streptomyces sp. Ru71]